MTKILSCIANVRDWLNAIDKTKRKWGWFLVAVGFFALAAWGVGIKNYFLSIPFVALIAFGGLLNGMHSCRELLRFCFTLYITLGVVCYFMIASKGGASQPVVLVIYEIVLTIVLVFTWSFTIGVADHDVGKLAAQVVNTLTTILLIILGVLVAFGSTSSQYPIWNQIQAAALYILLPFVIAGNVAMLFKTIQIYWEKKYGTTPSSISPNSKQ